MHNLALLAAEGPNNPILPATNELIWGTLAFLVLVVLMTKKGYPAVKAAMDDRTEHIRASIDEADRTRTEAQTVLVDYQRQVADAKGEAARIIEEARQTADSLKRRRMRGRVRRAMSSPAVATSTKGPTNDSKTTSQWAVLPTAYIGPVPVVVKTPTLNAKARRNRSESSSASPPRSAPSPSAR